MQERQDNLSRLALVSVSILLGAAVSLLCIISIAVVDPQSPVSYVLSLDKGESVFSALQKEITRVRDLETQLKNRDEEIRTALLGIRELVPATITKHAPHETGLGGGIEGREISLEARLKALGRKGKSAVGKNTTEAISMGSLNDASLSEILRKAPLGAPVRSGISSGFGLRASPFASRIQLHEGIDFDAQNREPIYATGEGVVRQAGYRGSYGYSVIVDHGYGIETLYAHLSKISVRVGDQISRGQNVGLVGSTGHSTGPHLHYEVRVNGLPKNPLRLVQIATALRALI